VDDVTTICVFCGSNPGTDPAHRRLAEDFGTALGEAGLGLVYGGGHVGLMGAVADAAMQAGAPVVGVIPAMLAEREVAHLSLTELLVVADMHERKAEMYRRADAFCALPGGYGTFEEVFEATTWSQLGLHEGRTVKPVVLFDPGTFWDPLALFLDQAVVAGFVKEQNRSLVQSAHTIEEAFAALGVTSVGDRAAG
jgi:uncharacterized protein (TIGR00730 family)